MRLYSGGLSLRFDFAFAFDFIVARTRSNLTVPLAEGVKDDDAASELGMPTVNVVFPFSLSAPVSFLIGGAFDFREVKDL